MSGSINAQSFGVLTANFGSVKLDFDKGATGTLGGLVAKPVTAGNKTSYAQEQMPGTLKGNVVLTKGMSLAKIRAQNGSQLIANTDTGQRYIYNNAVLTKDVSFKSGAGANVALEWSGDPAVEVIS